MPAFDIFKRISRVPTNPGAGARPRQFDVVELYRGAIATGSKNQAEALPLDEMLRQAYFWIVNNAIISPHYDIEFNDGPAQSFVVGDAQRSTNGSSRSRTG